MDHYLETIGIFYDEKVKFLSNKDNFIKCNDCSEIKEFKETSEELTLTCGEIGDGECGIQINIKFPKYVNYEKEVISLKEKINSGLNWESINNYIDVKDKIKDKNEKKKRYKEEIDKIVETFNKVNLDHKKEKLQKFYDNRILYIKECKELQYKLKRGDGDELTKKGYTEDYVKKVLLMNSEYEEIRKVIRDLELFMEIKKPVVKIVNTHHLNDKKKKRSKTSKSKEIPEGGRVRWEKGGEFFYGIVLKDKGKRVMIKPDKGGKALIEKKIIEKVEEDEPEPEPEIQSEINYYSGTKDWKWLSTFNKGKPFMFEGIEYPTVEHAFQAQKVSKDDPNRQKYQETISKTPEANDAKKLGGKNSFKENNLTLREDWDDIRLDLMEKISYNYYLENKKFMKKLIETDNINLVHKGFRIDGFWGVNKKESNNHHGKILMILRKNFKTLDFEKEELEEEELEEEELEEEELEEEEVKEGVNVKWTLKGKDFEGVVLKIDKRMKVNVNVMNTDGDIVKVKKTLLKVY